MRHLIDTTDISVAEVDKIINTALDIIANRENIARYVRVKNLRRCSMSQVRVLD